MKLTSCYKAKIRDNLPELEETLKIFRSFCSDLIPIIPKEWKTLGLVYSKSVKSAVNLTERLIHKTKENPKPKYSNFDSDYPYFPSYFRRAAIAHVLGAVSSWSSSHKNWEDKGKVTREPKLTVDRFICPVFYKGKGTCMIKGLEDFLSGESDFLQIKLYDPKAIDKRKWRWFNISCRHQDIKYLQKIYEKGLKDLAPSLIKKGNKNYYLAFPFEDKIKLKEAENKTVLAVDLGINTDATCCVMDSKGNILGREFINFSEIKDKWFKSVGRISKQQSLHGYKSTRNQWRRANNLSDELAKQVSKAIVDVAIKHDVDTIVFEYLDIKKKAKGSKKWRIHFWRKNSIQKMVEHKAHANEIHVSHVCAWNTSRLAFDGSGKVERFIALEDQEKRNYSLCRFQTGKTYNCDLNASYNIGARFFLREMCSQDEFLAEQLPSPCNRTYSNLYKIFNKYEQVKPSKAKKLLKAS